MMQWRKSSRSQLSCCNLIWQGLRPAAFHTDWSVWHRLRDKIEGVLNTDRTVRLVVQLEAALHDSRFEVSCCFPANPLGVCCKLGGSFSVTPVCAPPVRASCYAVGGKFFCAQIGIKYTQEAAHLRDELAREYDMRAQAAVRQKQQLDL